MKRGSLSFAISSAIALVAIGAPIALYAAASLRTNEGKCDGVLSPEVAQHCTRLMWMNVCGVALVAAGLVALLATWALRRRPAAAEDSATKELQRSDVHP